MIHLFGKLKQEKLLKEHGRLLDLGSGNGSVSEPFFRAGYQVTLVDKDRHALESATQKYKEIHLGGFEIVNNSIENFEFKSLYDGVIISNVLPFVNDKRVINRIVGEALDHLHEGGFLYLTLFGDKDQWAQDHADTMQFFDRDEALSLLDAKPHYISEDYGQGTTLKGDTKTWHIFSILYIK